MPETCFGFTTEPFLLIFLQHAISAWLPRPPGRFRVIIVLGVSQHGLSGCLFAALYDGQRGTEDGQVFFDIRRGVKQGDVLSAVVFNCVIDMAFRRWKNRLSGHGWSLVAGSEHFTNARYADDIMLFAKSKDELVTMSAILFEECPPW